MADLNFSLGVPIPNFACYAYGYNHQSPVQVGQSMRYKQRSCSPGVYETDMPPSTDCCPSTITKYTETCSLCLDCLYDTGRTVFVQSNCSPPATGYQTITATPTTTKPTHPASLPGHCTTIINDLKLQSTTTLEYSCYTHTTTTEHSIYYCDKPTSITCAPTPTHTITAKLPCSIDCCPITSTKVVTKYPLTSCPVPYSCPSQTATVYQTAQCTDILKVPPFNPGRKSWTTSATNTTTTRPP
ncbi:uncharacterized protein BCR38DRAFT_404235 [Pseudomassariella vexata]|uniref:Uncharacterized protein n=1 Tax=Pseudomassariella vexata TaxID=1141098 RepID=A0A1Y2EHQ9_9PEZI|nr:uncharacterized protein BCR38DRAFT_404235 [Pseudomassariella vexata]ORY71112.1 hypothetical protein BCR38DRAFT_404235 [Pseudomassariella vexata]